MCKCAYYLVNGEQAIVNNQQGRIFVRSLFIDYSLLPIFAAKPKTQ